MNDYTLSSFERLRESKKTHSLERVGPALPASTELDLHLDAAVDLLGPALVVDSELDHVSVLFVEGSRTKKGGEGEEKKKERNEKSAR